MPEQLALPSAAIEGVGASVSADLKRLGIHTVGDLLRVEPDRLHRELSSSRSLDQVRGWCQMAGFLQIPGMTPQWAEALRRAGLTSLAELRSRDLQAAGKLFKAARVEGLIRDVPSASLLCEILRQAAVIEFTGALNGTVLDGDDQPVVGAIVRIGKEEELTDERGRFRVIRIPLWAKSTLAISHPDYHPARFRLRQVQRPDFTGGQTFRVRTLPASARTRSRVLMEVRGDLLPPVGDSRISLREVEPEELVEHDILALTEFSAERERGRLVSKLFVYEEGEFWLPYVWAPVGDLGSGAEAGDCYLRRPGGAYEQIEMTPFKLRRWPLMLRARRQLGPPPTDVDGIAEWLNKVSEQVGRMAARRERF